MADTTYLHIRTKNGAPTTHQTSNILYMSDDDQTTLPPSVYAVLIPHCCRSSAGYSRPSLKMWSQLEHLRLGHNLFVKWCPQHLQCFWLTFLIAGKIQCWSTAQGDSFPHFSIFHALCSPLEPNLLADEIKTEHFQKVQGVHVSNCVSRAQPTCHNLTAFTSVLECFEASNTYTNKRSEWNFPYL